MSSKTPDRQDYEQSPASLSTGRSSTKDRSTSSINSPSGINLNALSAQKSFSASKKLFDIKESPRSPRVTPRTANARMSAWIAYHDETTGFPVYFNTITEAQTWQKPENAKITWTAPPNSGSVPGYDPEQLGSNYLDSEFVPPSIEIARNFHQKNVAKGGKASCCTSIKDIDDIGEGVQGFLYYARSMMVLFWVLSLLVLPVILTNISGQRIPADGVDGFKLVLTYTANAGHQGTPACEGELPDKAACLAEMKKLKIPGEYFLIEGDITIEQYATYCALVDLVVITVFSLYTVYFYFDEKHLADERRKSVVEAADYSILIKGLPPDAIDTEIIDHFSDLYNLQHVDWKGRMCPKPMLYPVGVYGNTCDVAYYEKWVAELAIANPAGKTINKLQSRAFLVTSLRAARAKCKVLCNSSHPYLYRKADHEVQQIEWQIKQAFRDKPGERKTHNFRHKDDVVCAYLTFNNEVSLRRCLEDYRPYNGLFTRAWQPEELKFLGEHPLLVTKAPDPSDIIWENLEVSEREVGFRRMISDLATLFIMLCSMAGITLMLSFGAFLFEDENVATAVGFVIDLFGEVLENVTQYFISLEYAHTMSDIIRESSFRLTYIKAINQSLLPIITQFKLFSFQGSSYDFFNGEGRFLGFPAGWYPDGGAGIMMGMVIGLLLNYIRLVVYVIYRFLGFYVGRCCGRRKYTQKQLNDMFTRPEFEIAALLSDIRMSIIVTFCFSSTMPIMIPIAAASFTIMYVFEKPLILRWYQKGPALDNRPIMQALRSMAGFMLFRTIVTIWLAGNPTVFWTPVNSEADKYSSADDSFEGIFLYPMLNQIIRAFFREHNLYHVMALAVLTPVAILVHFPGHRGTSRCCSKHKEIGDKNRFPPFTYFYSMPAQKLDGSQAREKCKKSMCPCCYKTNKINPDEFVEEEIWREYLTEAEIKQGWYVEMDVEQEIMVKKRRFLKDGVDGEGIGHKEGDVMRTWEVIRETALYSYNIYKNKQYTDLFKGKMIEQTLSSHSGETPRNTPRTTQ